MLPLLAQFSGLPKLTSNDELIYVFPHCAKLDQTDKAVGSPTLRFDEELWQFSKSDWEPKSLLMPFIVIHSVAAAIFIALTFIISGVAAVFRLMSLIISLYGIICAVLLPVRLLVITRLNKDIMKRNEDRALYAARLASPSPDLKLKIE